jgi:hypothetical protein
VFRYIAGGKEIGTTDDRHLDVVFVNAAPGYSRTYYEGTFDEENISAPVCWSAGGDKPANEVKNPQSPSCATCKQNIKGSGQGDSRACRFSQRVAVVLANDVGGEVFGMSLPATSIWGENTQHGLPLANYSEQLKQRSIDPGHIVTRMRFDTSAATPKLVFAPQKYLTPEEVHLAIEKGASTEAKSAITMTVSQQDGVKESKSEVAPRTMKADVAETTKAKPGGVVDVEEAKVRAKDTPKQSPKGNLADLVAQWGTDD